MAQSTFKTVIARNGYRFDDLATQIWLPKNATFHTIYESEILIVKTVDPISALISKAVKAKEKNRGLIKQALTKLGDELAGGIELNGGDLGYFGYVKGKEKNKDSAR